MWQAQAQSVYEYAAVADGFTKSAVILAVPTQFKSLSCLNGKLFEWFQPLKPLNQSLKGLNQSLKGLNQSLKGLNQSLKGFDGSLGCKAVLGSHGFQGGQLDFYCHNLAWKQIIQTNEVYSRRQSKILTANAMAKLLGQHYTDYSTACWSD